MSRSEILQLATGVLFVAALAIRWSELRLVRRLAGNSLPERLNPLDRWSLRRLVRNGSATLVGEGRYAFIPDGYAVFRRRRRVRALVWIGLLLVALVILWQQGVVG